MGRVVRTILVAIAAVCAVAAARTTHLSAQSSAGARGASGKPGTIRACSLLTTAEIKKLAGHTIAFWVDPEESLLRGGVGSECHYSDITIQVDAYPIAEFDATRKTYMDRRGTKFQPVSMGATPESAESVRPAVLALAKAAAAKLR